MLETLSRRIYLRLSPWLKYPEYHIQATDVAGDG